MQQALSRAFLGLKSVSFCGFFLPSLGKGKLGFLGPHFEKRLHIVLASLVLRGDKGRGGKRQELHVRCGGDIHSQGLLRSSQEVGFSLKEKLMVPESVTQEY